MSEGVRGWGTGVGGALPTANGQQPGAPRGTTLIELLMVLAVLAISAAIVGLALGATTEGREVKPGIAAIAAARREALATGRPVIVTLEDTAGLSTATAMPDGSVIVGAPAIVDRLTGRVKHDDR